jgi:hypothetical protein
LGKKRNKRAIANKRLKNSLETVPSMYDLVYSHGGMPS